jgi:hypothetical protein
VPVFANLKPYLIGGAVLLLIALCVGSYWSGSTAGKSKEQVNVLKANVKTLRKVKKDSDAVDKATPYSGSDADIARFLLDNARAN